MGDLDLIPGLGRSPREGNGYPLQYSDVEHSRDYIVPWGHTELDMTEQLHCGEIIIAAQSHNEEVC